MDIFTIHAPPSPPKPLGLQEENPFSQGRKELSKWEKRAELSQSDKPSFGW